MTVTQRCVRLGLAVAAFGGVLTWSGNIRPTTADQLFSQAEARIGRPLTPLSYAGVARRTTRRAVYVGTAAAVAAPYPTTVVVAPAQPICRPIVDPYGRIIRPCP
jgi:hypothetical protein